MSTLTNSTPEPTTKYPLNHVTPGTTLRIAGYIEFARIATQYDGEALQRKIERQLAKFPDSFPMLKPHVSITIKDPVPLEVITLEQQALANILASRFYPIQPLGESTPKILYQIESQPLPSVYHKDPNGEPDKEIVLENELATGSSVELILEVYQPPSQPNHGLALRGVRIIDPVINYYQSRSLQSLAQVGIKVHPLDHETRQAQRAAASQARFKREQSLTQPLYQPDMQPYYGQITYPAYPTNQLETFPTVHSQAPTLPTYEPLRQNSGSTAATKPGMSAVL